MTMTRIEGGKEGGEGRICCVAAPSAGASTWRDGGCMECKAHK